MPNKKELQQTASNNSLNIEFKYFMKVYKDYSKEPFSFLVKGKTLSLDNSLRFMRNVL